MTITILGNTLDVTTLGPGAYINGSLGTILFIPGIGTAPVSDAAQVFSNTESGIGIGDIASDAGLFYLAPSYSYTLATDFGPEFYPSAERGR